MEVDAIRSLKISQILVVKVIRILVITIYIVHSYISIIKFTIVLRYEVTFLNSLENDIKKYVLFQRTFPQYVGHILHIH